MKAHNFFVGESGILTVMDEIVSPATVVETIMHLSGNDEEAFTQLQMF
jgi:hypothetical protein